MDFTTMSDLSLVEWLAQYAGRQAGYYPGLRRTRIKAESEAKLRGIEWQLAQQPKVIDLDAVLPGRADFLAKVLAFPAATPKEEAVIWQAIAAWDQYRSLRCEIT